MRYQGGIICIHYVLFVIRNDINDFNSLFLAARTRVGAYIYCVFDICVCNNSNVFIYT